MVELTDRDMIKGNVSLHSPYSMRDRFQNQFPWSSGVSIEPQTDALAFMP